MRLSGVRLERLRDFGDVWLALGRWRMLGLDELLEGLIESGREDVSWGTVAAILTIARFCEPSSELHIEEKWYRRTALKEERVAGERLGRLKEKNWRASHVFDVTIKRLDTPRGKQTLQITWSRNARFAQWAELSEGCYLLRSNLADVDAATLWKRYIQLTEAEWAFRIAKDELEIRPIWHQKEDRVKAHILICFLAYAMWKTLAGWMAGAGLGDAPRTLLYELAKIKSGDVVLPAKSTDGVERTLQLRCVTEPDRPKNNSSTASAYPSPAASDIPTSSFNCSEDSPLKSHLSPYANVGVA